MTRFTEPLISNGSYHLEGIAQKVGHIEGELDRIAAENWYARSDEDIAKMNEAMCEVHKALAHVLIDVQQILR